MHSAIAVLATLAMASPRARRCARARCRTRAMALLRLHRRRSASGTATRSPLESTESWRFEDSSRTATECDAREGWFSEEPLPAFSLPHTARLENSRSRIGIPRCERRPSFRCIPRSAASLRRDHRPVFRGSRHSARPSPTTRRRTRDRRARSGLTKSPCGPAVLSTSRADCSWPKELSMVLRDPSPSQPRCAGPGVSTWTRLRRSALPEMANRSRITTLNSLNQTTSGVIHAIAGLCGRERIRPARRFAAGLFVDKSKRSNAAGRILGPAETRPFLNHTTRERPRRTAPWPAALSQLRVRRGGRIDPGPGVLAEERRLRQQVQRRW